MSPGRKAERAAEAPEADALPSFASRAERDRPMESFVRAPAPNPGGGYVVQPTW